MMAIKKEKTKRINKWNRQFVVQGNYGDGWYDLHKHDNRIDARNDYQWFQKNESNPHRIIERRILNPKFKPRKKRRK